jgi:DNA-binding transcriptional regulator GbsR (MarR family)
MVKHEHVSLRRFIARFADALIEAGFPRMPGRVFAALLGSDSGRLTSAELCTLLKVSPAAVSGAVRYLSQVNLLTREGEPGSRREFYCVQEDVWYEAIARRDRTLSKIEDRLREGLEVVGRKSGAGRRLAETLSFFEFIQHELPRMLEKWRARKSVSRDEVAPPASASRS